MNQSNRDRFLNNTYVYVYLNGHVEGSDQAPEERGLGTNWELDDDRVYYELESGDIDEFSDDGDEMDVGD